MDSDDSHAPPQAAPSEPRRTLTRRGLITSIPALAVAAAITLPGATAQAEETSVPECVADLIGA